MGLAYRQEQPFPYPNTVVQLEMDHEIEEGPWVKIPLGEYAQVNHKMMSMTS